MVLGNRSRVEAVFRELDERGLVAAADYECCTGCACYRMANQEVPAWTRLHGVRPVGYVFFHEQDTDSANEGGPLYLAHGAIDELNDEVDAYDNQVRVAEMIVEAFQEHGFVVHWDGSVARKIKIEEPWGGWGLDYDRSSQDDDEDESWDDGYRDGDEDE